MRNIGRQAWRLVDREGLANLLREEYGPKRGWRLAAAHALGLTRDQVTRLLDGTRQAIRHTTFQKLVRGLPRRRRHEVGALFLGPAEREHLAAYDAWLGYPTESVPASVSGTAWGVTVPLRQRGDEALPPRPEDLLTAIRGLRLYGGEFKAFRERLRKQWGPIAEVWNRADAAELAAVAPLAAARQTGGVERSAWELHEAGELGAYLHAALRAQLILLRRPPATRRVRGAVPVPTRGNPLGKPLRVRILSA